MKYINIFLGILCSSIFLNAQPFYDFHTIDNTPGASISSVIPIDMDGDTDIDIITLSASQNELAWFEKQLGGFGPKNVIQNGFQVFSVNAADFDNDGLTDIVLAGANGLVWYKYLGNGSFGPAQTLNSTPTVSPAISVGDLDGSGNISIVVSSSTPNGIYMVRNMGVGNFGVPSQIGGVSSSFNALGDLDGDGDLDILTEDGSNIIWYENTLIAVFGPPQILRPGSSNHRGVFVEDANGDGDDDAVFLADNMIGYYENLGNGSFSPSISVASGNYFSGFETLDYDLDNDLDIVTFNADPSGHTISWIEQTNPGVYSPILKTVAVKPQISTFLMDDLDGDTDKDILLSETNQLVWLENIKPTDKDNDGFPIGVDCDDNNPLIYPGANEPWGATQDYNCDGVINGCPDFSPVVYMEPNVISGPTAIHMVISVTNIFNTPSDGSLVRVRIPNDPRFIFNWDPNLTFCLGRTIQNVEWNYQGIIGGLFHEFWYKPAVFPAASTSSFGFWGNYDPQNTDGQTTATATIIPFSGGECSITNNTDSERLVYFK